MTEKYIKASECEKYFYEHLDDNGMIGAMNAIDEMPAADVQPIRRGRWVTVRVDGDSETICNNCYENTIMRTDFCPHCGADMRGNENA